MSEILFVSSMALFPETRFGGSKRLYWLAKALSEKHSVTLVWMDGSRELEDGEDPVSPRFVRSIRVGMPSGRSWWRKLYLPEVDNAPECEKVGVRLEEILGTRRFSAAVFAYPLSLSLPEKWIASVPRLLYLDDDLLLEAHAHGGRSFRQRLVSRWKFLRLFRWMRARLRRFDTWLAISEEERAIAVRYFPRLRSLLLPYVLPVSELPLLAGRARPNTLGFIGNYLHPPNLDAAQWLVAEIFPAIRMKFPDARLVLAGAGLPRALHEAWNRLEGVSVLGEVQTLESFYGGIDVFINPIRTGRGMRTKLIEAAAFGRPILSTSLGAEGAEALRLVRAESPADFAEGFRTFLEDPEKREKALSNRQTVERNHDLGVARDLVAKEALG